MLWPCFLDTINPKAKVNCTLSVPDCGKEKLPRRVNRAGRVSSSPLLLHLARSLQPSRTQDMHLSTFSRAQASLTHSLDHCILIFFCPSLPL